jgi:hypothetical protein
MPACEEPEIAKALKMKIYAPLVGTKARMSRSLAPRNAGRKPLSLFSLDAFVMCIHAGNL